MKTNITSESLPFDAEFRGAFVRRLDDRFSYSFDFENPGGVKLLGTGIASRVRNALENKSKGNQQSLDEVLGELSTVPRRRHGENARPRILDFWVHLVHGCNFSCNYCYVPQLSQSMPSDQLDRHSFRRETIEPILTKLFAHCEREGITKLGLKFAGGEPTLNLPLLDYFCETALRLRGTTKVTFGIITNGSFAHGAVEVFKRYRFNVSISVDGTETAHNEIRFLKTTTGNRIGTFAGVIANAEALQAKGIQPYFLFTVTPRNCDTVGEFSSLAQRMGLGFRLSLVRLPVQFSRETLEKVGDRLVELYVRLGDGQPISQPIERFARFAEWNLSKRKILACSSGKSYFAIDQNGRVSTCQMKLDRTYGSLAAEDFRAIRRRLESDPQENALTVPESRGGPCTLCRFFHVCTGGCPQHTKSVRSTYASKSPWCEVFGRLVPVYLESVAKQMVRAYDAKIAAKANAFLAG